MHQYHGLLFTVIFVIPLFDTLCFLVPLSSFFFLVYLLVLMENLVYLLILMEAPEAPWGKAHEAHVRSPSDPKTMWESLNFLDGEGSRHTHAQVLRKWIGTAQSRHPCQHFKHSHPLPSISIARNLSYGFNLTCWISSSYINICLL